MQDRRREDEGQATGAAGRDEAPTTSQLRDDIDSGRTHDKVAKSDPAAAPLGTDAEAAGAPPTPEEVSTARRHETARSVPGEPPDSRAAPRTARGGMNTTVIWAVVAVVVVAIVLAFVF